MQSIIIQTVLITFIIVLVIAIYMIFKSYIKEKRISSFALSKKDVIELSLFESINKNFWKFIHSLSKHLGNSKYLNELSTNYDKYIMTSEGNFKSGIDYITIKVITTIISIILVVLLILMNTLPNNIFLLILFMIVGFLLPDFIWLINYYYKRNIIFNRLYESIIILSKSLKKHSIEDSIITVINELDGPIQDEYKKILIDISYNIPIKNAFLRFYKRTRIKELINIYHILDVNSDNLYDAFLLIREEFDYLNKKKTITNNINSIIDVLSYIFILLPIIFVIMTFVIYPDYFNVIAEHKTGYLIVILLVFIYLLLIANIKKIMGERK